MSLFKLNIKKMKAKKDVEGLIKALDYKKDYDVISDAILALGELRDKRAVEPLFHALGDSNLLVEGRAAEALEVIGEPAVEYLFKALEDDRTEHVALVTLRNMRARGQLGKETLKKLKKLDYIII